MTAEGREKTHEGKPDQEPRRLSPRLAIRRLVIIACPHWKKYREVYSKNISRRSLMIVCDDPPAVDDTVAIWMGVDNLDRPRAWTEGVVLRLQEEAGSEGETGVAIQLTDAMAEAIWCLIPRGDEDDVPLPRTLPRFPSQVQKQLRETGNENLVPDLLLETLGDGIERSKTPARQPRKTVRLGPPPVPESARSPKPPPIPEPSPPPKPPPVPESARSPKPPPIPEPTPPPKPAKEAAPKPAAKVAEPTRKDVTVGLLLPAVEVDRRSQPPKTPVPTPLPDASFEEDPLDAVPTARLEPVSPMPGASKPSAGPTADRPRSDRSPAAKAPQKVSTTYVQHHQPRSRSKSKGEPERSVRQIGARPSKEVRRGKAKARGGHAPVVGIDFGTTYSKVAIFEDGEVTLIEDTGSSSSTRASVPSVVAYRPDGAHAVGESAQELLAIDPAAVIHSVKRVMGLNFSDPLANGLLASLACPAVKGPNDSILFDVHGQMITVPEVASRILGHLRKMASDWVGADVKAAVFTMPVDFDRRAKRELELAARMAGLELKGLIPEPIAAAMGCGYDGTDHASLAVYDFGGGTFDASIVEVGQNSFKVRGAAGDRWLGGDDFDELMARYVADEFYKKSGVALRNRAEEWQRLIFACEEAKRWLSTLDSVDVVLPRAAQTADGPVTLLVPVTRTAFEEIIEDIVASSIEVCNQATRQAGISPHEVDSLLITGGTTRIPVVREAAQRLFRKSPAVGIHPQHAVVIGAAVRAAVLSGASVPEDYASRLRNAGAVRKTIGVALAGGATEHIITSAERAPVAAHRLYSTARDGQTTIRIELVQGESVQTAENRRVGGFVVDDLPPQKAGEIGLDVYFELSTTGTLHVTAQERSSGQRAQGTFDVS